MANIEVDQSIKINDLGHDTVLAVANGVSFAIVIPANTKRIVMEHLRKRGKSQTSTGIYFFSIALYLLLRSVVKSADQIIIDVEYVGWGARIRDTVARYLQREYPDFDPTRIIFRQIGKKSRAHTLAIQITRKQRAADKSLSVKDFLAVLPKRK